MPCYGLLGIEICIPSVDDITGAIVAPITNFVTSSLTTLVNTLGPLFDSVVNTLSPLFEGAINAIIGFLSDPLGSIQSVLGSVWGALSGLWTQISGALTSLWDSITAGLSSLGVLISTGLTSLWGSITAGLSSLASSIEGLITSSGEAISGALSAAGASISGALEAAGGALLTAFDGMGNAISGIMGGIFSGFGSVDVSSIFGSASGAGGLLGSVIWALGLRHSPMTIEEARSFVGDFIPQVTSAYMMIFITNMVAEAASLGQVDFAPQASYRLPTTAAAVALATDFVAMPLEVGLKPLYRRYILRSYTPNLPSYEDMISIYVKEGYLEDHWVELPADMLKWFSQLGYDEFWTKRLWGKHWVYPSPTQLYDMLHRTAGTRPEIGVTSEILRNMLKLHDFEPKWRGPLEAISWGTWRIYDTRTAWEMGIDDDETLYKRLVDQGYEPGDARLLADVQKMFVLRSEIDGLTREAETDFVDGWIDEAQLKADFEATPYNPFVIELRIAKAKLRRDRELKVDLKAALTDRFKKGDVTETEYTEGLSRLGVVEAQIAAELERARAYKLRKVYEDTTVETKGLTEAKYSRAYRVGLITEPVYRAHLAALKYGPEDIDLLVDLNSPEKPAPEEIKVLTVTELKAGYRAGILSEDEFRTELKERRYLDRDIDLIVEVERERLKVPTEKPTPEEMRALTVGQLRSAFAAMVLTSSEMRTELAARRYGREDIKTILFTTIAKWIEENLRKAFRTEVITEPEFREELEKREYAPTDIERIVAEEKAERLR